MKKSFRNINKYPTLPREPMKKFGSWTVSYSFGVAKGHPFFGGMFISNGGGFRYWWLAKETIPEVFPAAC